MSCEKIFSKYNEYDSWQSEFNILSFKSNKFDMTRNIVDQTCIKYWNLLKKHMLPSFMKYFSGALVNQVVNS